MTSGAREHPANDQLRLVTGNDTLLAEPGKNGMRAGYRKSRFHDRFFGLGPNLIRRGSAADEQGERIHQDGFAGPRLARQDMKPGRKFEAHPIDQREVRNSQLGEHWEGRRRRGAGRFTEASGGQRPSREPAYVVAACASRLSITSLNCRFGLAPMSFSTGCPFLK